MPVFLFGLVYNSRFYTGVFRESTFTEQGFWLLVSTFWCWLGPSLLMCVYSLFLFWLGVLDGGDGHFFIAITPWCGSHQMCKIILWFYPAAFIFLLIYMLYKYKFNFIGLLKDQFDDTKVLIRHLPDVCKNIKNQEDHILIGNIPYKSHQIGNPPGMVPISAAVFLSYLF